MMNKGKFLLVSLSMLGAEVKYFNSLDRAKKHIYTHRLFKDEYRLFRANGDIISACNLAGKEKNG